MEYYHPALTSSPTAPSRSSPPIRKESSDMGDLERNMALVLRFLYLSGGRMALMVVSIMLAVNDE